MTSCQADLAAMRQWSMAHKQTILQEEGTWSQLYDALRSQHAECEQRLRQVQVVLPEEYQQSQKMIQDECASLKAAAAEGKPLPEEFQHLQHVAARYEVLARYAENEQAQRIAQLQQ